MEQRTLHHQASGRGNSSSWLEERHHFFVRQIISDFLTLNERFHTLYQQYAITCLQSGTPEQQLLDQSAESLREEFFAQLSLVLGTETNKGQLWRLKDTCHSVWPESERQRDIHGSLVDWLIGSLFHEAMKLKENIYLIGKYGSSDFLQDNQSSEPLLMSRPGYSPFTQLLDTQDIFHSISVDTILQIERLLNLFERGVYLFRVMVPGLVENDLVIRLLTEQEQLIEKIWGESLADLFQDIFSGNMAYGFCVAGNSYFKSQWYHRALEMYRRAVALDRSCHEAVTRVIQLRGLIEENPVEFGYTGER
ncbi:MAG: hypothetical protein CSB34_04625 [Desulfobulbus propionicus]|nr:MAG: hypothetical protein CSB34_04625 [Desulfobulbus propionicus]PIE64008.1 MAG: hypothetical protein CSA26_10265 [Desulfobacterales bacterium]